VTLELVRKTTSGAVGSGLTADNYQGMVAILDEFATAAGAAAMRVQHQRRGAAQPVAATLGPIVERGLAALDSLYELRNVIPGLMESSSLTKVDGKCTRASGETVSDLTAIVAKPTAHVQRGGCTFRSVCKSSPADTGRASQAPGL
jgi:hypothetical protein